MSVHAFVQIGAQRLSQRPVVCRYNGWGIEMFAQVVVLCDKGYDDIELPLVSRVPPLGTGECE